MIRVLDTVYNITGIKPPHIRGKVFAYYEYGEEQKVKTIGRVIRFKVHMLRRTGVDYFEISHIGGISIYKYNEWVDRDLLHVTLESDIKPVQAAIGTVPYTAKDDIRILLNNIGYIVGDIDTRDW